MIDEKRVHRKGGLIIYHLNSDQESDDDFEAGASDPTTRMGESNVLNQPIIHNYYNNLTSLPQQRQQTKDRPSDSSHIKSSHHSPGSRTHHRTYPQTVNNISHVHGNISQVKSAAYIAENDIHSHAGGVATDQSSTEYSTNDLMQEFHLSYKQKIHSQDANVERSFDDMLDARDIDKTNTKQITIVLDGANIGWGFGNDHFNVIGIELAQQYFRSRLSNDRRDFSIVTFIPSKYLRRKPQNTSNSSKNAVMETDEFDKLNGMLMNGLITLVPAGDNDDVYIISYARERHGFIVSNDLYADHVRNVTNLSTRRAVRNWIEENRCGYAFVGPSHMKEFMINPSSALSKVMNSPFTNFDLHDSIFQSSQKGAADSALTMIVREDLQVKLAGIHALSQTIMILADNQQALELKYTMMARAYALLRYGFINDCRRDLEFILTQLDSNYCDAITLLSSLGTK